MGVKQFIRDHGWLCAGLGLAAAVAAVLVWRNRRDMSNSIRNAVNGSFFTISELCASGTAAARGIDNTPPAEVRRNLQNLITGCLDPLRARYGAPITVSSGYRCPALNAAVGGAANSQHLTGQAADLVGKNRTAAELRAIFQATLDCGNFDQLIFERNSAGAMWVHVSHNPGANRGQLLSYRNGLYTTITRDNWKNYC